MKFETLFSLIKDGVVLDVEEWSALLGIEEIEFCRFGTKIPNTNGRVISKSSYWTAGIRRTDDESINEQVAKLLDTLIPKKNEINMLINKYGLECGVSSFVWVGDDFEVSGMDFYLESNTIHQLAELQADFDICIYQQ